MKSRWANLNYKASLPATNLAGQAGGKQNMGARCWAGPEVVDAQVHGPRRNNQNAHYHIGVARGAFRLTPSLGNQDVIRRLASAGSLHLEPGLLQGAKGRESVPI